MGDDETEGLIQSGFLCMECEEEIDGNAPKYQRMCSECEEALNEEDESDDFDFEDDE